MEILTVLNDYNTKNREEIHLTPFFYFLFWLEINIIIFLFSWKLLSVGPVEQLINLEWPKYENILVLADFNACTDDETMKSFCSSYGLHSLIKQPTCYKNPENPSCIDLILTNKAKSFQSTCVMETGLSDFHRMTISVLKMHFCKLPPKVISYRDFKSFENESIKLICCRSANIGNV